MLTRLSRTTLCLAVILAAASGAWAESHLMRLANVSADQIVFTYEDDLWVVPIAGGMRAPHHGRSRHRGLGQVLTRRKAAGVHWAV